MTIMGRRGDKNYTFQKRVGIKEDEAFACYIALDNPSTLGCHRELVARGVDIGLQTVYRWARRHNWAERLKQVTAAAKAMPKTADLAILLKIEASWLDAQFLKGLQLRIATCMAQQIDSLELRTPGDYALLVDVIARMDSIIHYHRGEGIAAPGHGNGIADPLALDEFRAWRPDEKGH